MAFWDIDLETRMGAESAAHQGGLACFIFCGFSALAVAFTAGSFGIETPEAIGVLAVYGVLIVIALIAGFRLRAGKGVFWGIAAAAAIGLSALDLLLALSIIGAIIRFGLMFLVIQGIRGALTLRKGYFAEDDFEVFE